MMQHDLRKQMAPFPDDLGDLSNTGGVGRSSTSEVITREVASAALTAAIEQIDALVKEGKTAADLPRDPKDATAILGELSVSALGGFGPEAFAQYARFNGGTIAHGNLSRGYSPQDKPAVQKGEKDLCDALIDPSANLIDPKNRGETLMQRGVVNRGLGNVQQAESDLSAGLKFFKQVGEYALFGASLRQVVHTKLVQGDLSAAHELARETHAVTSQIWEQLGGDKGAEARSPLNPKDDVAFQCMAGPATLGFVTAELAIAANKDGKQDLAQNLVYQARDLFSTAGKYVSEDGYMRIVFNGELAYRPGCEKALFYFDLGQLTYASDIAKNCVTVAEKICADKNAKPNSDSNYNCGRLLQGLADRAYGKRQGDTNLSAEGEKKVHEAIEGLGATNPILKVWRIQERLELLDASPPGLLLGRYRL